MSGIIGIVNLDGAPVDRLLLGRMTDYLAFRGPDAQETWSQGPVGLGHTLLRTVDDTRPDCQPLTLDGQVWIVADARVDGRGDLRQKLRSHGCRDLEEATDAELILQSYLVWGEACVQHLIGDFAFAIWDEPRRRLFAARDHLGIKLFYYARVGNCLVFSNTLNCLRMHPEVSDELNDLAIADFLLFNFNQDPDTTTFADINRVPPAHCLTLQDGGLQVRRYWTLPQEGPLGYARQQDYVEHFKALLAQAVADRLRTRQVGVAMSGGLDSTLVAVVAKGLLAAQGMPFDLRAHNVVYDHLVADEERHFSDLVARHLDIPIQHLPLDDYALYERWDQVLRYQAEPDNFPHAASWTDFVAQAAPHSRVLLTGEGGDVILMSSAAYIHKMFRGVKWGRLAVEVVRCALLYGRLPPVGFRTVLNRLRGGEQGRAYPAWLNPALATRLELPARWRRFMSEPLPTHPLHPETCRCLLGRHWQHLFETMYDPGGYGIPVQFCHPLFDLRLVRFALALPPLPWCVDKTLVREAGRHLLPEAVRRRGKAPVAEDPIGVQLRQPAGKWVDHFRPAPGLARYVKRDDIPLMDEEKAPQNIVANLRPLSLNFWLSDLARQMKKQ
jgi:asparagine synthase (glutamine-hydrolysing)